MAGGAGRGQEDEHVRELSKHGFRKANPDAGITIKLGKVPKLRSKGFSNEDAHRILTAALNHKQANESRRTFAAKRVPERVIDAIQGHAPRSVGQQYGDVTIEAQANAISKIPYYSVKHVSQ